MILVIDYTDEGLNIYIYNRWEHLPPSQPPTQTQEYMIEQK